MWWIHHSVGWSCTLYLSISPAVFFFILNTHLWLTTLVPLGCSTMSHMCASARLFNSALIASSYHGQSGRVLTSSTVAGSRPSASLVPASSVSTACSSSSSHTDKALSPSTTFTTVSQILFGKSVPPSCPSYVPTPAFNNSIYSESFHKWLEHCNSGPLDRLVASVVDSDGAGGAETGTTSGLVTICSAGWLLSLLSQIEVSLLTFWKMTLHSMTTIC